MSAVAILNGYVVTHNNPKCAGDRPHTAPEKELRIDGKQIGQRQEKGIRSKDRSRSAPAARKQKGQEKGIRSKDGSRSAPAARKQQDDELEKKDKEKFKNTFLDSDYNIKEDVHKEFKRL